MDGKTLRELATVAGGELRGDGGVLITGAASIEEARPGDITFVADRKLLPLLRSSKASAAVSAWDAEGFPNIIMVKNPLAAFSRVVEFLKPLGLPGPGVHPRAEVHAKARVAPGASVQAFAVVEEGAEVGEGTVILPGAFVGKGAVIGSDCIVYQGAAIREGCVVGDRVIIHCNAVVGSDGFGYARESGRYVKVPQRGIVRIGDDVEIGACVTIDRATLGETSVGRGTKIDNLVQIAHNVRIGEDSVLVAQVGIAGSTRIGSRVQLGGQVGVSGHISIGDDSAVGAKSGVVGDLPPGSVYSGIPAIPHGDWLRAQSVYAKLPELKKRIAELERRLAEAEALLKTEKGEGGQT